MMVLLNGRSKSAIFDLRITLFISLFAFVLFVFSEYSIPDTNDMIEENLNESQDQMKTLMQLQVCTSIKLFNRVLCMYYTNHC